MLIWAVAGAIAGWFLASRMRAAPFAGVLIAGTVVPAVVCIGLRHFDLDVVLGYGCAWIAAQGGYFLGNAIGHRDHPPLPHDGETLGV